jgi:RNA polymerase sigma factor for flagellar operon FliA
VATRASADLDLLWSSYKTSGDRDLRDQLIVHYSPLVKYVAGRVAVGLPQRVEPADLVSYGIFGLIDAIERFEPDRRSSFESYAIARIKGAIIDELRSLDWVPRSVRAKARSLERAYQDLEARLKRVPTDAELAAEVGLQEDQLQSILAQVSFLGLAALDETFGIGERAGATTLGETLADRSDGPVAVVETAETQRILAACIAALPERERVVLTLYYYEGLTLAEIGTVLSVTESRVSQVHTKAVIHLRARLAAADRDPA